MAGTTEDLLSAIHDRRYLIMLSREGIQSVQEDLKSKKRKLQELEMELVTLERALSILRGSHGFNQPILNGELPLHTPQRASRHAKETGAVFTLAEEMLRVERRPLTVTQLLPHILLRRARLGMTAVSREGVSGVLYRFAKDGKIFTFLGAGRFGLKEWETKEPTDRGGRGDLRVLA